MKREEKATRAGLAKILAQTFLNEPLPARLQSCDAEGFVAELTYPRPVLHIRIDRENPSFTFKSGRLSLADMWVLTALLEIAKSPAVNDYAEKLKTLKQ